MREYEGSRIRMLTRPETPAASSVLEEELGAILGVRERARTLVAFAAALRATHGAQRTSRGGATGGNATRPPDKLLTCGSQDPPAWCGNVCGGSCEWVRAGQAGAAEGNGGEEAHGGMPQGSAWPQRHGAGIGCSGFQSIAHLVEGSHGQGMNGGKVRVCGILMLSQEGVSACSALLSGQRVSRIPALLSCGIAGQQSIARRGAALFCRVHVLGKHCKPLATFFHSLGLGASGTVWKDQCVAQVRKTRRGWQGPDAVDEGGRKKVGPCLCGCTRRVVLVGLLHPSACRESAHLRERERGREREKEGGEGGGGNGGVLASTHVMRTPNARSATMFPSALMRAGEAECCGSSTTVRCICGSFLLCNHASLSLATGETLLQIRTRCLKWRAAREAAVGTKAEQMRREEGPGGWGAGRKRRERQEQKDSKDSAISSGAVQRGHEYASRPWCCSVFLTAALVASCEPQTWTAIPCPFSARSTPARDAGAT